MRLLYLLGTAVLVALSGCATQPLPKAAATISLAANSTASVGVYPPRFENKDGHLVLEGFVYKQYGARTTRNSHLDIMFLDSAGNVLRLDTAQFTPQDLIRRPRMPQYTGRYSDPVGEIPAGTVRIEVRGHDGPRAGSHS